MNNIANKYNMIVAADENWCIGNKGDLLDHFPEDLKMFKYITSNKFVIMGERTQKSLPNHLYLKNRFNIVLTNNNIETSNEVSANDKDTTNLIYLPCIEAIPKFIDYMNISQMSDKTFKNYNFATDGDVFVVGGGYVYREFLENDLIDTIYLTKIHHKYNGDTFIPDLYELGFKEINKLIPKTKNNNGIKYEIIVLKK